jgi:putative transposase
MNDTEKTVISSLKKKTMPVIQKDIRDQILERIKQGGSSVAEISRQHGVSSKTVYGWLHKRVDGVDRNILEINRLKKENKELKELLGQLLLQIERGKKN